MKIIVCEPNENRNIHLWIPNSLLMNRLTLMIVHKALEDKTADISLNEKQLKAIMKELKKSFQYFGHFELVSIESNNGEIVKIIL